jgi:hypothetical protein
MTRPKPIDDPTRGQYQVVVSFRIGEWEYPAETLRSYLWVQLTDQGGLGLSGVADLDVAVREIGAASEASVIEGEGP